MSTEVAAPKTGKLAVWEDFQSEIKNRADELASQLPSNVSRDRFINAAIAAVKQTPEILKATPRSLFAAITKAAQDGLVPDGREGIITVYGVAAQWNPMIYGLRKRARELDDIIVDAQVIRANDEFQWDAGDDPKITHRIKIGERGAMIGAYAIFKNGDEGILHREVMDADQIAKVREQSRAKDSLMWTKFDTEAWRKTVARRGFKSVPCSAPLERLVQRDDDLFDFSGDKQIAPPPPPAPADDFNNDDSGVTTDAGPLLNIDAYLVRLDEELAFCVSPGDVEEGYEGIMDGADLSPADIARAEEVKQRHIDRVSK